MPPTSPLFKQKSLINGQWRSAADGAVQTVRSPIDLKEIGHISKLTAGDVADAVQAAQSAFAPWAALTAKDRGKILKKFALLMEQHQSELAQIMALESGKIIRECAAEILYAASFLDWFAEEGRRIYGDVIPSPDATKRLLTLKQPIGVVAAITPWNFPAAMITRKIGPALAAGCTVVLKPASQTPYSALALGALALEAGVPPGVFNIVTGASATIGDALTGHPAVRVLTFTGSTRTGQTLYNKSSDTLKKLSLELGGNAPFIVFDDADLEAAVDGLIASKFRNNGQTCVCANRVLVHKRVYDDFTQRLSAEVKTLTVGDPRDTATDIGPVIDENAFTHMRELVADAAETGADILHGGVPAPAHKTLGGYFFMPTILSHITPRARCWREEIFGPLISLTSFNNDEEALKLANDSPHGLASYFYTRDLSRAWTIAERLEAGMVGLNTGMISYAEAPFGGVKMSGLGREGSKYGIEEFLNIKYVAMQI